MASTCSLDLFMAFISCKVRNTADERKTGWRVHVDKGGSVGAADPQSNHPLLIGNKAANLEVLTTCCAKSSPASCRVTLPDSHYCFPICSRLKPNATTSNTRFRVHKSQMPFAVLGFSILDADWHPGGRGAVARRQPTPNALSMQHLHGKGRC